MNKHIKLELIPVDRGREDGSGDLRLESLTDTGFLSAVEHFNLLKSLSADDLLPLFRRKKFTKLLTGSEPGAEKYEAYYKRSHVLRPEFFKPYRDLHKKRTGMDIPDQEFDDPGPRCCGLIHVHFLDTLSVKQGSLHVEGYLESRDWDGNPADRRAVWCFADTVEDRFVYRDPVLQHIEYAPGLFRHNPKFGTGYRNPAQPRVTDKWFFDRLMRHWFETYATPDQRELVEKDVEVMAQARCSGNLFTVDSGGKFLRKGWETGDTVSWEEFVALGGKDGT